MKKLSYIIATAFLMFGFAACDVVEEPYKKDNNSGGNGGGEEPNPEVVVKHVLLEDYTGVACVNCPAAGQLALDIQERYNHQVIVLGVHAGSMTSLPPTMPSYIDFTTPEGTEWYTNLGLDINPIGTINRKLNGSTYGYNSPDWEDKVASTLQEEALLEMTPAVEYDNATRELSVEITSRFLAELPDTYSLTVCIMEDSIVAGQLTQQGSVSDYIHRHVFRTTMNGAWGEDINIEPIAPEDEIVKSYTTTLNAEYNADQCYIIAYVSNSNTKEILQVVEKKIK